MHQELNLHRFFSFSKGKSRNNRSCLSLLNLCSCQEGKEKAWARILPNSDGTRFGKGSGLVPAIRQLTRRGRLGHDFSLRVAQNLNTYVEREGHHSMGWRLPNAAQGIEKQFLISLTRGPLIACHRWRVRGFRQHRKELLPAPTLRHRDRLFVDRVGHFCLHRRHNQVGDVAEGQGTAPFGFGLLPVPVQEVRLQHLSLAPQTTVRQRLGRSVLGWMMATPLVWLTKPGTLTAQVPVGW
jgi:hypothetical protein